MIRILAAICTAFLFAACVQETPKITDPALVARNSEAFKKCLSDRRHCEGGYVKWIKGPIVRISSCDSYCNNEMGLHSIQYKMSMESPWLPSAVEWVALPPAPNRGLLDDGKETMKWEIAAIDYARQFVAR